MKIFVTVGTTPFDSLVKALDKPCSHEVVFQIASGKTLPKFHSYFEFVDSIEEYYKSDIVFCHAGAGTVYPLLERGVRLVVVPNLERKDKHQLELAEYLDKKGFCVCINVDELCKIDLDVFVDKVLRFSPSPYKKTDFFSVKDMLGFFYGEN